MSTYLAVRSRRLTILSAASVLSFLSCNSVQAAPPQQESVNESLQPADQAPNTENHNAHVSLEKRLGELRGITIYVLNENAKELLDQEVTITMTVGDATTVITNGAVRQERKGDQTHFTITNKPFIDSKRYLSDGCRYRSDTRRCENTGCPYNCVPSTPLPGVIECNCERR